MTVPFPAHLRPWSVYLVVALALAGSFTVLPADGRWRPAVMALAGLVSSAAMVAGMRQHRAGRVPAWMALTVAHVLGVVGWSGLYLVPGLLGRDATPSPLWTALFLLAPGLSAVGVYQALSRSARRDRSAHVDTLLLTVSVGVLSWVLLLDKFADEAGLGPGVRLASTAFLVLNLALLGVVTRLAFTIGSRTRARLVVAWAAVHLAGNALFSMQALQGTFQIGGPVFATWLAGYAFLGAAALHPAVRAPQRGDPDPGGPDPGGARAVSTSPLRKVVLVAAVAPLPVLTVVRLAQQSVDCIPIIAAGSVVLAALAILRTGLATPAAASREVRRRLRRSALRLVALFVVTALVPLASLTYLGVKQAERALENEVRDRMTSVAAASENYLSERIEGLESLVASYAERPGLTDALTGSRPDVAELQRHLDALFTAHPDLHAASMLGPDGTLLATTPLSPGVMGDDFSGRDYFRGGLIAEKTYVSEAFIAARPGNPRSVGISAPIRGADGRLLGVLAVGYRLDGIRSFADRLAHAQRVDLTVTDRSGVLLAGTASIRTGLPSATGDPRVVAALRGQDATMRFRGADGAVVTSYRQIPHLGWAVVVETPESVAFASERLLVARVVAVAVLLGQIMLMGLVAAVRSDRGRLEVEGRLTERDDHLRSILEAAGDAFIAIDVAGRVTEWNARAVAIFGYTRDEALGAALAELIIPVAGRAEHHDTVAQLAADHGHEARDRRLEVIVRRADGAEFPAEVTVWRTTRAGQPTLNAFVRDVTERKRHVAELADARDAALEASRLKSEFVANMSHEIRTPMNGVLGMTSLLLDTDLDPVQRDYAETVGNSAEGLLTVINDILDFSKVEAGKLELEEAAFLVRPVVEDVVRLLSSAAQAKRLTVTALVDDDVPRAVRGDSHRLRQVLTNLVGNAVKFTEHGEIAVLVSTVETGLRFSVRDSGIGIPADQHERLFQAFTQADPSTTRKYGGTGLGLTISRQLVELMGGVLDFRSAEGKGTTFWADLPLPAVTLPIAEAPVPDPTRLGAGTRPRSPHRVLVAEDNQVNQRVVVAMLDALGYDADVAADGQEALEMFSAGTYAAVFMDCQMPRLDGYAATRAIRALDGPRAGVPVIALTASALAEDEQRCRDAGMDDFVAKPLRRETLERMLVRWVAHEPHPTAAPDVPGAAAMDPRALAELAALGPEAVAAVVTTFLDALPEQLAALRAAVDGADADAEQVRRVAHGLRGSAGYVGATALAEGCARLEEGPAADVAAALAAVEAAAAHADGALRAELTPGQRS
ncbi:MAG TPA: ATP-binding protein [Mycobacteriales bacterium]|nr:ATP-binding protein [Mycobacteriales bacterium]